MSKNNTGKIAFIDAKINALTLERTALYNAELAALPATWGYTSTAEFIAAVEAACGKSGKRGRPRAATREIITGSEMRKPRAKRAILTDQIRSEVKRLTLAGQTGEQTAKAVGISIPSVNNIKKALGLVKARS